MHGTTTTQFNCVNCNALYHLIKREAGPETVELRINLPCLRCAASFTLGAIRPQVPSFAETKLTPALKLYQADCWPVARSDGRHPSTVLSRKTAAHFWPLAEWMVERIRQSTSRSGTPPLHHSSRPADRASAHKATARARMTAQSRSWKSPDRKRARSPAVVSGRTTKQPILHLSAASRPRNMREPAKRDCRHKCLYKKLEKKHEAMKYALIFAAESLSYGEKCQSEQGAAASAPRR
jgi:hypothetical protein